MTAPKKKRCDVFGVLEDNACSLESCTLENSVSNCFISVKSTVKDVFNLYPNQDQESLQTKLTKNDRAYFLLAACSVAFVVVAFLTKFLFSSNSRMYFQDYKSAPMLHGPMDNPFVRRPW